MKILALAPQPFFSPRGTPFSVYYRTRVICELGHQVDLLTYGQGEDVDIPGCRILRIPAFGSLGPVAVGPSMKKLVLDIVMVLRTTVLLLRGKYDVVHAHEEAVFWCRWLKPLFRFRLIYDMHSSLPQQLSNFQYTDSRIIHWLFTRSERSALRAADAVIAVCPALSDYASQLTDASKVILIENSLYDPVPLANGSGSGHVPASAERSREAEEWMRSRQPANVLAYAGTLEVYQGIDIMLEAFAIAGNRMPEAALLIIGGSPEEVAHYRGLAEDLGVGASVHFSGQVSQPDAQRLVAIAGVAISPRLTGSNSPMKLYQLMADGIAVVATDVQSHMQVLNSEIAILSHASAESLAEAMVRALSDREAAREVGRRAQEWYRSRYSRAVYRSKMTKVLSLVT